MTAVQMPNLGYDIEQAAIVTWCKQVGDSIRRGEPLLEVQTDKSALQVEAQVSGRVAEILFAAGEEVAVGTVIAHIDESGA
jgi:pyruvate/2-oxoglutarate dehydrogenase complex dihydrolipoamide acyltransferase (E2) component